MEDITSNTLQRAGQFVSDVFGPEIGAFFEGDKAIVGWGGVAAVIFIVVLLLRGRR